MGWLFLSFTLIPVLELFVLIRIGRVIGPWYTILMVIVVGVLGASLAKRQGLRVLREWQEALSQGRMPEEGVMGGLLILLGGLLLITPGVISDVIGLVLLLPWTRKAIVPHLSRVVQRQIARGTLRVQMHGVSVAGGPSASQSPRYGANMSGPGMTDFRGPGHTVIDTEGEDVR